MAANSTTSAERTRSSTPSRWRTVRSGITAATGLVRDREDPERVGPERERQLRALPRAQGRESGRGHVALEGPRPVGERQAQPGEGPQELDGADARDQPRLGAVRCRAPPA